MSCIFEGLIQNIPAIFYRSKYDAQWTMLYINAAIEDLTGYLASDFIHNRSRSYNSIIHPNDKKRVRNDIQKAVNSGNSWMTEYRLVTADNKERWVIEMGIAVYNDEGIIEYLDGFIQDVSERKTMELSLVASEQQVRDMAFTDCVTGLANRNLFTDRLDQLILDSSHYSRQFALLFIDLDGFKKVNDTYGHQVGDKLLAMSGERITESFRDSDVVARFGGDEFLVIMKNTSEEKAVSQVCNKLLKKLAAPHFIDDLELAVTASIGVANYPQHATLGTQLIRLADKAMYEAKKAGRNGFVFYCDELPEASGVKQG